MFYKYYRCSCGILHIVHGYLPYIFIDYQNFFKYVNLDMLKTKESGNAELFEVTQKLLKLDFNDLTKFFEGFNAIYKDLKEKKLILEVSQV